MVDFSCVFEKDGWRLVGFSCLFEKDGWRLVGFSCVFEKDGRLKILLVSDFQNESFVFLMAPKAHKKGTIHSEPWFRNEFKKKKKKETAASVGSWAGGGWQ